MSFSQDVKRTLVKIEERTDAERRAKLAGILRGAGSLGISREGVSFSVSTENTELVKKTARLVRALYGVEPVVTGEDTAMKRSTLFTLEVAPPLSERILTETGLLGTDEDGGRTLVTEFSNGITDEAAAKSFLSGLFLGCGSVIVPEGERNGYHLEFALSQETAADETAHLLAEFDFIPKKVARKSGFVIYLKESGAICDFFAFLGAGKVVLEIAELMTERNLRNTLNRQANCATANMDKSVMASVRQIEAIEAIESTAGLDALPDHLRRLAELRLLYQTDTLDELAEKLKVSKSGINHRFRKIIQIANELGGSHNDV